MSDLVIRTADLTKIYRLYKKPIYRLLDLVGLLAPDGPGFAEHVAVDGVNLEIRRGEKVAIIGRNGAGKSTLLKLITRVIHPSKGAVEVNGTVHALLNLGTGFHPDISGRENVSFYLSYLGVDGEIAKAKIEEIIEFAELEEYIDQPFKTYSTGMGMRLMFAAATAVTPDLLLLDEVLGVGDGYFAQKSFERMRTLCEAKQTTLLLVSHDLYSAMKMCDRFIWIDQGRVILDGDATLVVNRYEASIRDQQEQRLRRARLASLNANQEVRTLFGQIRCVGNVPIDQDLPVSRLTFSRGETTLAELKPGVSDPARNVQLILEPKAGNWSQPQEVEGRLCRCFSPMGSIYHRAGFLLSGTAMLAAARAEDLSVEIEFKDAARVPCLVEVFDVDNVTRWRADLSNTGEQAGWVKKKLSLKRASQLESAKPKFNRYGTQDMSITDVIFLNDKDEETHVFDAGDTLKIRLTYVVRNPAFNEKPVILVTFLKDGITRSHRFVLDSCPFDFTHPTGTLELNASPLLLGAGHYLINILVMREGGFHPDAKKIFFTVNENLLDSHARAYEINVRERENILVNDVIFLHPATWSKDGRAVYSGTYPLTTRTERPQSPAKSDSTPRIRQPQDTG